MTDLVFDPTSAAYRADPHAVYRRFREHSPVHANPRNIWFLTRYRDVGAVLADRRAIKKPEVMLKQFPPGPFREHNAFNMNFMDPPDHPRVRGTVARWFTPRALAELQPRIEAAAAELLAELEGSDTVDLVEQYAYLLPVFVIAEMLGVPAENRALFRRCSAPIVGGLEPGASKEVYAAADRAVTELTDYLGDLAEQRRRSPGGSDLLSVMVAHEQGDKLKPLELIHNAAFLLNAGHETTTNLIVNGMAALLDNPAELARLRREPRLMDNAVEEFLRIAPPLDLTFRRLAEDYAIGDITIPAGAGLILGLAAANRDPAEFAEPDRLDIGRGNAVRHLAFAGGPHVCLGATLARYEGRIAIRAFLDRYPRLRLARQPERKTGASIFQGFASLPIALNG